MSIKFAVETIFKARDKHSKQFNKMGGNAKKFGEKASSAFNKASKSASNFKDITKGILAAGAVTKSIGIVSQGVTAATTSFIDFDHSIVSASAKFKGLDLTTEKGLKTLNALKKEAREVGAKTKFSAGEAAGGLDFYATAGFNAEQAMAVLAPTAKLATVANLDLARTSDIASDSLGAFGLMTKNSEQLQKNFIRLSDVMSKTLTSSNVNMEDMFETIKTGAPVFTASSQAIETFNTLTGVLANNTLKGSKSGTQLKIMMLRLAKPTTAAQEALDKLNIKTRDGKGDFLDIIDILGDFEKGLKGMGTAEKAAAIKTIFGAEAITGVNILLGEGSGKLKKFRNELINSGGSTKKMADIMDKSLKNKLLGVGSALTEVSFKFFDAFGEKPRKLLDALSKKIRNFNMTPITNGLKNIIKNTRIWLKETDAINKIISIWKGFKEQVSINKEAVDDFVKFIKSKMPESVKKMDLTKKDFERAGKAIAFVFTAIIGKAILGLVASTGPFGLFLAGLGLIIFNWDKIINFFDRSIKRINKFKESIKNLNKMDLSGITKKIDSITGKIINFFNINSDIPKKEIKLNSIIEKDIVINKTKDNTIDILSAVFKNTKKRFKEGFIFPPEKIIEAFIPKRQDIQTTQKREPPNKSQVQTQLIKTQNNFKGQLNIAGAPQGSTFEQQNKADPIEVNLLGPQAGLLPAQ